MRKEERRGRGRGKRGGEREETRGWAEGEGGREIERGGERTQKR